MPVKMTTAQVKVLQHRLDSDDPDDVTPKKPRDNEEEREQILFFERREEFVSKYPVLEWMYATLNGVYLPDGIKKRVNDAGLTPGVLDIWFHGLYDDPDGSQFAGLVMDMKKKKGGRPSPDQLRWAARLVSLGYRVYFPAGATDAWRILCGYIGISGEDHLAEDMERRSEYQCLLAAAQK